MLYVSIFSHFLFLCMMYLSKVYPSTTSLGAMWDRHHASSNLVCLNPNFQFQKMRSYLHGLVMRLYRGRMQRYLYMGHLMISSEISSLSIFCIMLKAFEDIYFLCCNFCLRFLCSTRLSKVVIQCGRDFEFTRGRYLSLKSIWIGQWRSCTQTSDLAFYSQLILRFLWTIFRNPGKIYFLLLHLVYIFFFF